ncbi:MAG: transposase [Desulfovibrio sp.]|nr:transposase [Desulfovibrio sp.]
MQKRRTHAPAFKAKVALAALSGNKTIAELSSEYGIHQTLINK